MTIITDEMVEKGIERWFSGVFPYGNDAYENAKASMRAALEAVAPDIRDQVIEEVLAATENDSCACFMTIRSLNSKE